MSKRIVVCASGSGTDLQSILDAIQQGWIQDARVTAVISDNADAHALRRAEQAGAAAVPLPPVPRADGGRKEHERRMTEAIAAHGGADLVVLAGFMRILSADLVHEWHGRLINIHPALLPAHPGADGPGAALASGARVTGCTTHFVDEGVDSGPIILQAAVLVHQDDDRASLHRRILALEHQILPRTVDLFVQGRLRLAGRRVHIEPGDSWHDRVERLPEALYAAGF